MFVVLIGCKVFVVNISDIVVMGGILSVVFVIVVFFCEFDFVDLCDLYFGFFEFVWVYNIFIIGGDMMSWV